VPEVCCRGDWSGIDDGSGAIGFSIHGFLFSGRFFCARGVHPRQQCKSMKGKGLGEEQQGKLLKTKGVGKVDQSTVEGRKLKAEPRRKESPHVPAEACGKDAENQA
jgi:hypothetical protein